jgi:hypothetical protein
MADVKAKATAAGFDWQKLVDFISGLNWVEVMTFISQVIAIFRGGKKPMMTRAKGTGCGPEEVDAAKAHFEAIKALAECGCECCTGGTT